MRSPAWVGLRSIAVHGCEGRGAGIRVTDTGLRHIVSRTWSKRSNLVVFPHYGPDRYRSTQIPIVQDRSVASSVWVGDSAARRIDDEEDWSAAGSQVRILAPFHAPCHHPPRCPHRIPPRPRHDSL